MAPGIIFKKIDFNLSGLIEAIALGQIGLPDIQRPFVWPNTKVRDLFDSMYRGYPVGYLLLWENGASDGARQIGSENKQSAPQLLVIDGQQRLTSLYAVLRGVPVIREDFSRERIPIAFRPLDGSFDVANAAIKKDARWIPDISVIWDRETNIFDLVAEHLDRVSGQGELSSTERRQIQDNIARLSSLLAFPFTALQLSGSLAEDQVAEVFVRINSKGTPLNQADFILTLMSVFRDQKRAELERFCQDARVPTVHTPSPFNYFIEPDPDHLLRVAVGLGFRRARLQHVYSILRGKDLETGEFSDERREQQFSVLDHAQTDTLNLQNWKDFFKCIQLAGYQGKQMVSSRNALLYSYVYYLIGKRDYGLDENRLRNAIARWFFLVALTGRYTNSPEARMEQDLADLREVRSAEDFIERIDLVTGATFTRDYWDITLPGELATSSARSPALFAYYAALNLLDARALFSKLRVWELLDEATKGKKASLERHHLFPKAHLRRLGILGRRETNQIANFALIEWQDNILISDRAPVEYFPEFSARVRDGTERDRMLFWHGLPVGWETMPYPEFLEERRRRLAAVIRAGFESLQAETAVQHDQPVEPKPLVAPNFVGSSAIDRVATLLDSGTWEVFADLLDEPRVESSNLLSEISDYLARLEVEKDFEETVDVETAREVADRCTRLLGRMGDSPESEGYRLVQAATLYFLLEGDGVSDTRAADGFNDDLAVIKAVENALGTSARSDRLAVGD